MNSLEVMKYIFVDTFTTNLFFVFNAEVAFPFAYHLSEINFIFLLVPAFFGLLCSMTVNYLAGFILYFIFQRFFKSEVSVNNYPVLQRIYNVLWIPLACLCWIYLYAKLFLLFAGFARFSAARVILGAGIIRTISYLLG
ncbi:MAG: hypothetical protein SFT91_05030 [Rickettsiaceae bacterium]|nr:hypothetical protein [Rickettsiaceae bacterium]